MPEQNLIEYAMAQNVPLSEIERLRDKQAEQDFHAALSRFRCECPTIYKTVEGDGYQYESLADAIAIMADTLAAHGLSFFWIPAIDQTNGMINVTCKVSHEAGHSEAITLCAPTDTRADYLTPAQAMKATVSYLERVTLFAALGIAAKDMDSDCERTIKAPPVDPTPASYITQDEADELKTLHAQAGGDMAILLKPFTRGSDFKDLPDYAYFAVKEKLQARIDG